jgi:hypothetical protein
MVSCLVAFQEAIEDLEPYWDMENDLDVTITSYDLHRTREGFVLDFTAQCRDGTALQAHIQGVVDGRLFAAGSHITITPGQPVAADVSGGASERRNEWGVLANPAAAASEVQPPAIRLAILAHCFLQFCSDLVSDPSALDRVL